jgi:hypothetical protein
MASKIKADEQVILFRSSGWYDEQERRWNLPFHGWVFEPEVASGWRNFAIRKIREKAGQRVHITNEKIFERRARMFLVDNERWKRFHLYAGDLVARSRRSGPNGHFYGEFTLEEEPSPDVQWREVETDPREGDEQPFKGEIQMVPPEGLSVISDIDDTIKLSCVRDRTKLLDYTLNKPFEAIPGMVKYFKQLVAEGAAFHYVSSSPWQLYDELRLFMDEHGFPKGSFDLKHLRVKDRSLTKLMASPLKTKVPVIERIIARYPRRRFILVGDSTEQDAEVYAKVAETYADQIERVYIRLDDPNEDIDRFNRLFKTWKEDSWQVFSHAADL